MPETTDAQRQSSIARRASIRLIPFMFVLYIVSYLDRINIGFAALQMNQDLKFSAAVYGLGAGIFFVGYCLFEVPSNLLLERFGARVWIARIMITWGLLSAGMMFVRTPASFYTVRFLLGVAEAGFFPGMILYLTYWFPAAERARAVSLFMTATTMAGVIGAPISGALLSMHGIGGLAGWQWLFLVEGLPAVLLGFVVLWYLPNGPQDARWLSADDRIWLAERLRQENEAKERLHGLTLLRAFRSARVWVLGGLYFCLVVGLYGISFWLPQLVKGISGLSNTLVSAVSAIPYAIASVGMVLIGIHSDRTGERRWHVAIPSLVGAVGFVLSGYLQSPIGALVALSLAAVGTAGALAPFWTLPTGLLTGAAAAGGIALINSLGNVGGFVSPYIVGEIRERTGGFTGALLVLAGFGVVGALLVLALKASRDVSSAAGQAR